MLRVLNSLPNGSIRTFANIGGWIGFSVLMGVWSHSLSCFRRETKVWKIQTKSVLEVVNALKISFLSDLITLAAGLIVFFTTRQAFNLNEKDAETLLGLTVFLMLAIWFFSIPLLYEAFKRKSKVKTTRPGKNKKFR
jgi:hypothetical protein